MNTEEISNEPEKKYEYMFNKGSLLCLIAEIVRAYTPCVYLVTDLSGKVSIVTSKETM